MPKTRKTEKSHVGWYLVQSKVRQERVAELHLQRLEVRTLCPQFTHLKTSRGKQQIAKEPLFPGYLFVHVNISTEFRKVTYAKGILRVVMFGARPALVGEDIIRSIKSRMQDGLVSLAPPAQLQLNPGQVVHVKKGPFSGFEAIFEQEFSGTQRVALLMKAVAYQGRIIIDRDSVEI